MWKKDGISLQSSSRVFIQRTAIVFNSVQPDDAGEYCFGDRNEDLMQKIEFVVKGEYSVLPVRPVSLPDQPN